MNLVRRNRTEKYVEWGLPGNVKTENIYNSSKKLHYKKKRNRAVDGQRFRVKGSFGVVVFFGGVCVVFFKMRGIAARLYADGYVM